MNNNNFFVIADVLPGKLNALVKNIMKQTGVDDPNEVVRMVNAGEILIVNPKWAKEKGIIRFTVTSDGATGAQWIDRLESKGFRIRDYVKNIFLSENFNPTKGVTYEITVLKSELFSSELSSNYYLTTKTIREKAGNLKLSSPNIETACLIREKFSNAEFMAMGLSFITVMHEPIKGEFGYPVSLDPDYNELGLWLIGRNNEPNYHWKDSFGFAFVASRSSL